MWEEVNQAFDRLPLSAVIDHEIFCIHGGIPRLVGGHSTEIQAILSVPNVAGIMPAYKHGTRHRYRHRHLFLCLFISVFYHCALCCHVN